MDKKQVKFSELDIWLKAGIIGGLISLASFVLSFLLGMFAGAISPYP